jgi:hypothetical protein
MRRRLRYLQVLSASMKKMPECSFVFREKYPVLCSIAAHLRGDSAVAGC